MKLSNREQNHLRKELDKKESDFIRLKRRRLSKKDFETVKIIGRGAFAEVCITIVNILHTSYQSHQ